MRLVNAYTISPSDIKAGDEMLFIVKAMVWKDDDGTLRYRLYRCHWSGDENRIPQGSRICDGDGDVCLVLFPSLAAVAKEDRF